MSQALASQRQMRDRLRAALRRGLVAVLDVGSSKVACFILQIDFARLGHAQRDGPSLGGYGAVRIIGVGQTRSRGVRQGAIVEMDEAERAVRTALEIAEKMAGERVDQVIATLTGCAPHSHSASVEIEIDGYEVTEREVARALSACAPPKLRPGREPLHAMPVNFTLDGAAGLTDPRGMSGAQLGVDMHVLAVDSAPLRNLAQCVRRCDLELAGVVVTPYASGLSCLVEDELDFGSACIDMGGGTTSIAMFLRRQLIFADVVRMGGDHVTLDIARGLSMSSASAERIKTLHGGALATEVDDRDLIEAPMIGGEAANERRQIPRSALIGVIRPRLEETLELARDRLDQAGFSYLPGRQIVLTGGACQLPGVLELAQHILGRRVRIGRPIRLAGLPQSASGPAFSGVAGLAAYAIRPREELWDFEATPAVGGRARRALRWFRQNW